MALIAKWYSRGNNGYECCSTFKATQKHCNYIIRVKTCNFLPSTKPALLQQSVQAYYMEINKVKIYGTLPLDVYIYFTLHIRMYI